METKEKLEQLKSVMRGYGSAIIAFSGGVDSTLLLKVANDVLKDKSLAITANTSTLAEEEAKQTSKIAETIGAKHLILRYEELDNENFSKNPTNRCFYCKDMLFERLSKYAKENNYAVVIEGSNADDMNDHRPGMVAADNYSIKSPLKEVNLTKEEIRTLSKEFNLPTWNKPEMACLSSRVPFGEKITKEKLEMIDKAERFINKFKIKQLRVRHYGTTAKIEVLKEDIPEIKNHFQEIEEKLKVIGFKKIIINPEGYQRGAMIKEYNEMNNTVIKPEEIKVG